MAAIGIDLGTTTSCVAVWQRGNRVTIVSNERGSRTTPSYVAFDERKRLLGDVAKNNISKSPTQTVYDSKRLIGRSFTDNVIRDNVNIWPFTLVDGSGSPMVHVLCDRKESLFAPEEISAMMLLKMKQISELFLGDVKDAVIAVPVSFTDKQRQATIDAGRIAGLNVLGLIHETTAAAMTYGSHKNIRGKENVLVFNLGGGHVDVAVVTIQEGLKYTVQSTAGASNIGGEDFTNILIKHLAKEFREKEKKDVYKSKKACQRLRTAAERAKINLTSLPMAYIEIDALMDTSDLYSSVSKECLDSLCQEMVSKIMTLVDDVFEYSKMSTKDIDEVILVGGSSRVPEIQRLLKKKFPGKELNLSLNLDEAVAHGAAILAAKLSGESNPQSKELLVHDFSSRFVVLGGNLKMSKNINPHLCHLKNNMAQLKREFGPDKFSPKNRIHIIGECMCKDAVESSAKMPVQAQYFVDANGKLNVYVNDVADGCKQVVSYEYNSSSSGKDLKEMMRVAKNLLEADVNEKQREDSRHQLEKYAYTVKSELQEIKKGLRNEDWDDALKLCNETLIWVEANEGESKVTFDDRLIFLEKELEILNVRANVKRPISGIDKKAETNAKKLRQENEERVPMSASATKVQQKRDVGKQKATEAFKRKSMPEKQHTNMPERNSKSVIGLEKQKEEQKHDAIEKADIQDKTILYSKQNSNPENQNKRKSRRQNQKPESIPEQNPMEIRHQNEAIKKEPAQMLTPKRDLGNVRQSTSVGSQDVNNSRSDRIAARKKLQEYINKARQDMLMATKDIKKKPKHFDEFNQICDGASSWLTNNPSASTEEFQEKLQSFTTEHEAARKRVFKNTQRKKKDVGCCKLM